MGKAERTTDERFEEHVTNFTKQQVAIFLSGLLVLIAVVVKV